MAAKQVPERGLDYPDVFDPMDEDFDDWQAGALRWIAGPALVLPVECTRRDAEGAFCPRSTRDR